MDLFAFRGIRYGTDLPAGELAAPPYDQIDDAERDRLHAVSPHHFTHLSKPVPGPGGPAGVSAGEGEDAYEHAARLHREWLEQGVLEREARPALYPYAIELPDGGRRLGVCGMVGIEPPDSAAIRPHERTLDKPLADRLALLEAMRVDLEPVFLLSDDAGDLETLLRDDLDGAEPIARHRDPGGYEHRLYRVEDPERFERYRRVLARGDGAIADGHHRYKVARRFAEAHDVPEGSAAAAKLAVVTSLDSPALAIDPIHRFLADKPDSAALAGVALRRREASDEETRDGRAFAEAVARADRAEDAPGPALGITPAGARPEIWFLDPGRAPESLAPGARELPVVLLHEVLYPALGLGAEAATDGTTGYRSSPEALWAMVRGGEAGIGFWLPPMEPAAFAAAIAHGDMLPPKSTRFLPKIVSGLVWADHDSELA